MKKISILLVFLVLSIASISLSDEYKTITEPKDRDIFRVAIIGDRTGGNSEGLKYLERAVYEINQLNPDFVIHIGDMVQGYTRDQSEWLREMEEFKSYIGKLAVPCYFTAGNHDIFSPLREINDKTYEELFKKHFSPLNYSFDYKNSHFIILYTDEAMTSKPVISEKQLSWLETDLKSTNKTNIFIFMHKPIWAFQDSNWDKFHGLIKQFPVKTVIAGHFHSYYKDIDKDGIQYYVVGVAGGEAHVYGNDLTGNFHHYSILSVENDKYKLAVIKLGNVEQDDYVLADDYEKIWDITDLSVEKTGINGYLWQPKFEAVKGEIEIFANNPTDKEIFVDVQLDENMKFWSMEPSSIKLDIPAKSDIKSKVTLLSNKCLSEDIAPPQIRFQYNYINSKGQRVPVIIKRRVLLCDSADIQMTNEKVIIDGIKNEPFWQRTSPIFYHTWIFSIYERPDIPPKAYLSIDDKYLYFFVEVNDDKYSYLEDNLKRRVIFSDTIVFSSLKEGKRQDIVIFPFNVKGEAFIAKDSKLIPSEMTKIEGVQYVAKKDEKGRYYYCEGGIPIFQLFDSETLKEKKIPFNLGVIDNDLETFIYLRSWTYDRDPKYWGILNVR